MITLLIISILLFGSPVTIGLLCFGMFMIAEGIDGNVSEHNARLRADRQLAETEKTNKLLEERNRLIKEKPSVKQKRVRTLAKKSNGDTLMQEEVTQWLDWAKIDSEEY